MASVLTIEDVLNNNNIITEDDCRMYVEVPSLRASYVHTYI